MLKYRLTTIFFIIIAIIFIALNLITDISFLYLFISIIIYLIIVIYGVFNISLNFFINSINSLKTDKKIVSITFDDGPSENTTLKVLDVLARFNVQAAFFCIGKKVQANPNIVNRIIRNGHLIGNHSFTHSWKFPFSILTKILNEISLTNTTISNITGMKVEYFRPPFGITNPTIAKAISLIDMKSVGWTVRSLDSVKKWETSFNRLTRKIRPGSIILLHDNLPDAPILLENLLIYLNENHYELVRFDKICSYH